MENFVEIVHNGNPISLQEFADLNLIVFDQNFTIGSLFTYEGNDKRIFNAYNASEKAQYSNQPSKFLITAGTLMRIPVENVNKEVIAVESTVVVANENYRVFLSDKIKEIISDPKYKPLNLDSVDSRMNKTYRVHTNFTVWVWAKALGEEVGEGKIIDITPFVQFVTTSNGDSGGNFQLSIAPVLGEFVEEETKIKEERELLGDAGFSETIKEGKWVINRGSATEYAYNGVRNIIVRDSNFKLRKDGISKNSALFHNLLQSNDVVFIQFEQLEIEGDNRNRHLAELSIENLLIGNEKLPGRYFDMIGLIDTNTIADNTATADININITGRDLMKLLIEDGEYFFTADFAGTSGGITVDTTGGGLQSGNNDANKPITRLIDGNLNFFNAYVDRTIEYSLKFILNMLSNIQICDDKLFKYYEDKVKRYAYSMVLDKPSSLEKTDVAGIWQIYNLIIDSELSDRRLVDSSIVSDQGSLINFIQGKVVHKPFAEFFGDVYGDKYYAIARKPPFSKESYLDNKKYAIDIDPSLITHESLSFDDSEVYSWYRLIPKGNFFGDDSSVAIAYFPAKFFEEYAKIWGSRPLIQVSNYIDYQGIKDSNGTIKLDYLIKQAIQDLAFLIETNAYRPFTRKGTITLAMGDRRIKKGQCIRHLGTGEVFHVDAVSQSASVNPQQVDRSTVVQVSRGMIEKNMDGTNMNYFNIIDLDRDSNGKSKSSNFKVNKEVFQYFIKRQQFKK
jgi:hypothetical protein